MAEERQKQSGNFECQEFDLKLAAYLEGEASADVAMHAEQCSSCGSLLGDLQIIQAAAKDLPLESPSPRVWSNIRAALAEEGLIREQKSFWRRWIPSVSLVPRSAPAAALAFALMLAVIMIFKGDIQRNGSQKPALTPAVATAVPTGLSGVQSNLARTVEAMEENYKAREAALDPSAKQVYRAGLTSLNNSIQECLDSLQKQPHNTLVREYLMQAYSQKAEVLASALEYGGR
ncbi:MAG: hypothetical protein WB819_09865 [Terriglobia bacterium]|jgi:hypothetical protein